MTKILTTPEFFQWACYIHMGMYSSLCAQQTNDAIYVWDIAEQTLKFSVENFEFLKDQCRFGPYDNTLLVLHNEMDMLASVSIWDIAGASLQRIVRFDGPSALFDPVNPFRSRFCKLNPVNNKLIVGFRRDLLDNCLIMVEVDLDTDEYVSTKTVCSGELTALFVVPPMSILM